METYTRKDIEKLIGLPGRRIQFYSDEGLLTLEEDSKQPGRGVPRRYTKRNLLELALIKELAELNIEFRKIKRFFQLYKEFRNEPNFDFLDPNNFIGNTNEWYTVEVSEHIKVHRSHKHRELTHKLGNRRSLLLVNLNAIAEGIL